MKKVHRSTRGSFFTRHAGFMFKSHATGNIPQVGLPYGPAYLASPCSTQGGSRWRSWGTGGCSRCCLFRHIVVPDSVKRDYGLLGVGCSVRRGEGVGDGLQAADWGSVLVHDVGALVVVSLVIYRMNGTAGDRGGTGKIFLGPRRDLRFFPMSLPRVRQRVSATSRRQGFDKGQTKGCRNVEEDPT